MRKSAILLLVALLPALAACSATSKTAKSITDENPLAVIRQDPGYCSIFRTWGFIGDSMCSGEMESLTAEGRQGYHDMYEYSWGQYLCRAAGATGVNYSQGGETAGGWNAHFFDNNDNQLGVNCRTDGPKQAYIIALGANDSNIKLEWGDPDTDIDFADYTKNKPTFAGNYGGIIQRVQSIAPDAKIFVVTTPVSYYDYDHETGTETGYDEVVRQMPRLFKNVYLIDLHRYSPDTRDPSLQGLWTGNHLNAMGYLYASWVMMTYIDWIIRHNMEDFAQVAFINTPYRYIPAAEPDKWLKWRMGESSK